MSDLGADAIRALEATWRSWLAGAKTRVAFTDAADERVIGAAVWLADSGLVKPVLVGDPVEVARTSRRLVGGLPEGIEVLAPPDALDIEVIRDRLPEAPTNRRDLSGRHDRIDEDPLYIGAAALCAGYVDGCVSGATRPTADVISAALTTVGLRNDSRYLTSCFLMVLLDGRVLAFGDCAVIPSPNADQLAEVAIATSETLAALTMASPKVAMLSFSTKGSASHPRASMVREAASLAARRCPQLCIDGELQADAAVSKLVGDAKAPGSPVAGVANVLIFPSLEAGNISYKLVEHLGRARSIGPLLQGLRRPMNDLSRGCATEDVTRVGLVTAATAHLQQQALRIRTLERSEAAMRDHVGAEN